MTGDLPTSVPSDRVRRARAALTENPTWYHTIELAPGVVTQGALDLRPTAAKLLPSTLAGRTALDIGTFDGFWAFELERRGAEVIAVDLERADAAEWPPLNRPRLETKTREYDLELGRGFRLAAEVLDSSARRVICDVYDLSPERVGAAVDFVFSGTILLHLRDPVRGLERIRETLRPGGEVMVFEPISLLQTLTAPRRPVARFKALSSRFTWWQPNYLGLRHWLGAAGFTGVRHRGFYRPASKHEKRFVFAALTARRAG